MSLRQFVDNHPLAVSVTLVAVGAAAATGALGFFVSQRLQLQEDRHQTLLIQVTAQYEAKIEDFARRLASIERRVDANRKYFDVTKIMINRDEIENLSASHQAFIQGYLYASPPEDEKWSHSITNEWEIQKSMFPFSVDMIADDLKNSLASREGHVWQYSEAAEVQCELTIPSYDCKLHVYPLIYVMRVDRDLLFERTKLNVYSSLDKSIDEKEMDRVRTALDFENMVDLEYLNALNASEWEIVSNMLDTMEYLLDADVANLILEDRLMSGLSTNKLFENFTYRVVALQKKGNVLYMKSDWLFDQVNVTGLFEGNELIVSEEWFFVGTRDDGVIIRVMVPSSDGRSGAYEWINRWLSDFRVVL